MKIIEDFFKGNFSDSVKGTQTFLNSNCVYPSMSLLQSLCLSLYNYVTQHQQMRQMSAKFILNCGNRCATRSKLVNFFMVVSDNFWNIFHNSQDTES